MTMEEVCLWLGHSSVTTTETSCAFLDIEKLQKKYQKVRYSPPKNLPNYYLYMLNMLVYKGFKGVARTFCKPQVRGSSPRVGTTLFPGFLGVFGRYTC